LAGRHSGIRAQNGHFNVRLIAIKFRRLTWEECEPCLVIEYYTLAFTLQLREKSTDKTSVRIADKVPDGHDSVCRHGCLLRVAIQVVDPDLLALRHPGQCSVSIDIC